MFYYLYYGYVGYNLYKYSDAIMYTFYAGQNAYGMYSWAFSKPEKKIDTDYSDWILILDEDEVEVEGGDDDEVELP